MNLSKITTINESHIEKYLNKQVALYGGISRKWVSPNHRGVPDRICIFEPNLVFFVECKTSTGRLTKLQRVELRTLQSKGCSVFIVRNKDDVDRFIKVAREIIEIRKLECSLDQR